MGGAVTSHQCPNQRITCAVVTGSEAFIAVTEKRIAGGWPAFLCRKTMPGRVGRDPVCEIDLPGNAATAMRRCFGRVPPSVTLLAIDFEADDLAERLDREGCGHGRSLPSPSGRKPQLIDGDEAHAAANVAVRHSFSSGPGPLYEEALLPAPVGATRFVISATRECGVGVRRHLVKRIHCKTDNRQARQPFDLPVDLNSPQNVDAPSRLVEMIPRITTKATDCGSAR